MVGLMLEALSLRANIEKETLDELAAVTPVGSTAFLKAIGVADVDS
jgi:hypothetical protein